MKKFLVLFLIMFFATTSMTEKVFAQSYFQDVLKYFSPVKQPILNLDLLRKINFGSTNQGNVDDLKVSKSEVEAGNEKNGGQNIFMRSIKTEEENKTNTSNNEEDDTIEKTAVAKKDQNKNKTQAENNTATTISAKEKTTISKILDAILEKLNFAHASTTNISTNGQDTYSNVYTNKTPYYNPSTGTFSSNPNSAAQGNAQNLQNQSGQNSQGGQNDTNKFIENIIGQTTQAIKNNGGQNQNKNNTQATPYNGPGGSLPGECGIPKGPMAYNIGGTAVTCNAKTIFVGYKNSLRAGVFGGGYINPLVEDFENRAGASLANCAAKDVATQYGEKCFTDYSSGAGQAYIDEQILHWKSEAAKIGQKCIPVDIDNCDTVGAKNYEAILDRVEFQNKGGAIVKVMIKNPHNSCNFFKHKAAVGAFVESATREEAQKIDKMRAPGQVLLFASGSGSGSGKNVKLKQLESLNLKNVGFSYDKNGEYNTIYDCTYNP